ncbi:hypothetical protein JW851_00820 [Candidatus Woesearchaeota archaeon]|nr:hypothetical protein [Candidatus Woesearchaeota archaeon]
MAKTKELPKRWNFHHCNFIYFCECGKQVQLTSSYGAPTFFGTCSCGKEYVCKLKIDTFTVTEP